MEEKWYTDDKIFSFDFTINYPGEVKPQVSVIIYRDKYYAQNVKKEIQFNCPTEFALLFEDHIDIQGSLTYRENSEKSNYILWGNFHYGKNYGKHFDGTMILFPVDMLYPPSPPLPPPPPPPSPPVLMDCKIVDMRIGENRKDDLFPYIYMRKWPVVSKEDLFFNFIFYEKKIFSPPGELLIDNLIARAYQQEQMILLAIDYIDMNWPPPITFVAKIENLPGPIISFPEVYHKIRQRPFTDYEELISIIENTLGKSPPELLVYMESAEYLQAKERVWQSYFALIFVQGYQEELLEGFLGILITDHLIEIINGETVKTLAPEQIKKLIDAVIVVPFNLFPIPGSNASPPLSPPISSPHTGIIPYAIGELQMVRQQFLRYEAGEIAHIENILKGEKKEIKRRYLDRTGETSSEEIASAENIDNSSLGKRINFLNEALKTIENNTVTTDYSNLKTSYGPPNVIIYDGSWTVTEPGKKKEEMTMFARDIINKTVNRINRRVKEARYNFALNESEETTTSVFDNSRSAENLNGIYRWLNKVYRNFVVNYGRRLMMEFVIKEPASVYIQKEFDLEGISLSRPKSPSEKDITSYNEIKSKDYGEYATQYTGIEPPPEDQCTVSAVLINEEEKLVSIPEGYQAKDAYVTTSNLPAGDELQILIGKNHYMLKDLDSGIPIMMNDEDKIVPIAVIGNPVPVSPPAAPNNFVVTVEISCEPSASLMTQWQVNTFNTMNKGYREQLAAYYREVFDKYSKRHREANREIIQKEIMNCCLRRLMAIHLEFSQEKIQWLAFEELRYIQFFEQVFEWNEMYFVFQESLEKGNNKKITFPNLVEYKEYDKLFTIFLQADYARIFLPVRPGFDLITLFYLATGIIWEGKRESVPVLGNQEQDRDLEIVNELKKITFEPVEEKQIGASWEIRVPTSMQILGEFPDNLNLKE